MNRTIPRSALPLVVSASLLGGCFVDVPPMQEGESASFLEQGGRVVMEAENFHENNSITGSESAWYPTSDNETPEIAPDNDVPHLLGSSNDAYVEVLPKSSNLFSKGSGPTLRYRVHFQQTGRYYLWVRAFRTSGDNSVYVGFDGAFIAPLSKWCTAGSWTWSSRTAGPSNTCSESFGVWIDVATPGEHELAIAARESGAELDKIVLSMDSNYEPTGQGPTESRRLMR